MERIKAFYSPEIHNSDRDDCQLKRESLTEYSFQCDPNQEEIRAMISDLVVIQGGRKHAAAKLRLSERALACWIYGIRSPTAASRLAIWLLWAAIVRKQTNLTKLVASIPSYGRHDPQIDPANAGKLKPRTRRKPDYVSY